MKQFTNERNSNSSNSNSSSSFNRNSVRTFHYKIKMKLKNKEDVLSFVYCEIIKRGTNNYDVKEIVAYHNEFFPDNDRILMNAKLEVYLQEFGDRVSDWLEYETTDYDCITDFIDN